MPAPDSFARLTLSGKSAPAQRRWGFGTPPVLISRALYRTRVIDLTGVRVRDRQDALSLQLEAWAPFDSAAYVVGLIGSHALAFAWDRVAVAARLEDPSRPEEPVLWPEELLRPPLREGVRLHACLEGFEAQAWKDGVPQQSRWWPGFPDEAQWRAFLHGRIASQHADVPLRDAGTPWRARPWLRVVPPQALGQQGRGWERLLWGGVAGVLAVAAGVRGHEHVVTQAARDAAAAERERWMAESGPALKIREQVLRDQTSLERIGRALDGVRVFDLLSRLEQSLPPKGVLLRDLRVEGSTIRVSLAIAADMPRSEIVQSLQTMGRFVDVRELREPGVGGSVTFEMLFPSDTTLAAANPPVTTPASAAASVPARKGQP